MGRKAELRAGGRFPLGAGPRWPWAVPAVWVPLAALPQRCLREAFPRRDADPGKARGTAGCGPVAASVQVAHTERTTSLVWRHMIKIFSPLPLPEAIYCFSAASPLGQRARRCSRPRDAPVRSGGTGGCGHRVRVQPWPLAARLPWGEGRSLALPSHLRSSTVWGVSSILTDTYFTFKNSESRKILHLFVLYVTFWFTIYVFFLLNPEANTHPL